MKQRFVIGVLVVLALLTVGLSAQVVLAQTGTGTAEATAAAAPYAAATGTAGSAATLTLAPGQSASIPANFWCLDFGKPFPTGVTGPSGQAPANVTKVLAAAASQGTVTSNAYQTQLAVWYSADGTYHDQNNQGHALAQQLVAAAQNASAPSTQNLGQLMSNGGLTVTVQNFQAVPDTTTGVPPYHGTGTVVVSNTSNQTVTFVVDGAVFQPANAGAQTLVAQTGAGEPQVVGTSTAVATSTEMATSTAVAAVPTATVAPTEVMTSTATVAPTATVMPTATVAPTETAVAAAPTATATTQATPATLPTTGAGDANGWMYVLLVFGALILFAGFGLGFRRASK